MITVQSPHECQAIIGHENAINQITESFNSGRMHHAWLLTGAEGIGKASLAYQMAHMILSGGENRIGRINPNHAVAKLIAAQSHPDLLTVARPFDEKTGVQNKMIPVDEARKLAPFLSLTPSFGQGRFAFIDEAHTLNRSGQNAILKMIEEPPTGAFVVLTATTIGMMLPTIRSRCRVVSMDCLQDSEISTILARQSIDLPQDVSSDRLYALAGGSVGRTLKLLDSGALPLFDELLLLLSALPQVDLVRVHALADQLSRKADADKFQAVSQMMIDTIQNTIRAVAAGRPDPVGLAAKIAPDGDLDKALLLWESTKKAFATAEQANLDKKLTFINVISEISRQIA